MKTSKLQSIIIVAWLLSFGLCLFPILFSWLNYPSQREIFIKNVVETFMPGLGVMLLVIFKRKLSRKRGRPPKVQTENFLVTLLTIMLCGFYLLAFDMTFILFFFGKIENLETVNSIFGVVRPYTTWLVTPVVAYYFGDEPVG